MLICFVVQWTETKNHPRYDSTLTLIFTHPWRELERADEATGAAVANYYWNTHDNVTSYGKPEVLKLALDPPPPEVHPEPEQAKPKAGGGGGAGGAAELCPGWSEVKNSETGAVESYHNTLTRAKRSAGGGSGRPTQLTRAEMNSWQSEASFKYTASGMIKSSGQPLGVEFRKDSNNKPRVKKIKQGARAKTAIPLLCEGMMLDRIALYEDGSDIGEELKTGSGKGNVGFDQALKYLKEERPIKLTFNHRKLTSNPVTNSTYDSQEYF